MGVGNYTETDVKECAKAFTGWTIGNVDYMMVRSQRDSDWPYGRISWHYEFDKDDHDNGEKEFLIEGNTVKDIIKNLSEKYGESFKNKILDKNGNPKPVINIYINDENIKFLDELSTELNDKDEILFLPAVSGG